MVAAYIPTYRGKILVDGSGRLTARKYSDGLDCCCCCCKNIDMTLWLGGGSDSPVVIPLIRSPSGDTGCRWAGTVVITGNPYPLHNGTWHGRIEPYAPHNVHQWSYYCKNDDYSGLPKDANLFNQYPDDVCPPDISPTAPLFMPPPAIGGGVFFYTTCVDLP